MSLFLLAISVKKNSLEWIKKELDNAKIKYFLALGNHDSFADLDKTFNFKGKILGGKLCYSINIKDKKIIILDSSTNSVSDEQLEFLKNESNKTNDEILLFIHHPVIKCGCYFMDNNFALKNLKDVMKVLKKIKNIRHIFCGHYHTDKKIKKNNKTIYITPSTLAQIDEKSKSLIPLTLISSLKPGYRIIEWDDKIYTYVKYLI